MKIGLLIPVNGFKHYKNIYSAIVVDLQKKGHEVIHPLSFEESMLSAWSTRERNAAFNNYYNLVKNCDIIIAECSYPCTNIGFEIANTIEQGKKVIILQQKQEHNRSLKQFNPMYTKKNVYFYEYHDYSLKKTISKALSINPNQKYREYKILLTNDMVVKLNELTKKKNLNRLVYIKELLEKGLTAEK